MTKTKKDDIFRDEKKKEKERNLDKILVKMNLANKNFSVNNLTAELNNKYNSNKYNSKDEKIDKILKKMNF